MTLKYEYGGLWVSFVPGIWWRVEAYLEIMRRRRNIS